MFSKCEVLYGRNLEDISPPEIQLPIVNIGGNHKGNRYTVQLNEQILSRHILLVGGTGSGKTNLFYHIVDQLKQKMTNDDVMLIFDTKGDFYQKFYSANDVVIGNSSEYYKQSAKWNLYEEVKAGGISDRRIVEDNVREISNAIFHKRIQANNSNPFFLNAARDLFASIIIVSIRDKQIYNNRDLKSFFEKSTVDELIEILCDHDDMRSVETYIGGKAQVQAQGVLSELYSVLRELFIGVFAEAGNFSIRKFIRNKGAKTAFVEYDLSIGETISPLYSLLFDLALKEALGRNEHKGNVYIIADELKLLPDLKHIEDGINFGRSLGVKILAGLQTINQLNAVYENETQAENIINGFGSLFAFGACDYKSREFITNAFGKKIVRDVYSTEKGEIIREQREGFTVEDWDLKELKTGEAVCGLSSDPPFRFKFDLYQR